MSTPDPVVDAERLAVVARSGLMDSRREPIFDELARVVARLLDAPLAFVTIVDDRRSFWKATYGVDDGTRSNTVEESFCQYVIRSRDDLLVDDAATNAVTRDNPSIDGMGVRSWAGAPIMIDRMVVGGFCVVDTVPRMWTAADRDILHAFRDQVEREFEHRRAMQVERSERELDARALADLRAELVPAELPRVPGLDVAGWHHAASDGAEVLGDFYDVFRIDEHRWGIALGDVCGHGVAAARLTALMRYTLRAAATHTPDPAEAVSELDLAVQRDLVDPGRFATLSYLEVDTADTGTIRRTSAGHPPPVARHADGTVSWLTGANASPVGVATRESRYGSETLTFPVGTVLLLYSDGATDARDRNGTPLGADALGTLVRDAPAEDARSFVECVSDGILSHAADDLLDDVALLAIRFGGRSTG
ncbi:MAG: SpoIIE family protein phosphatase [Ilumatobacter sp.]|nr:SpoIIE family protein phosphatase [Ilumatobacter sp.]